MWFLYILTSEKQYLKTCKSQIVHLTPLLLDLVYKEIKVSSALKIKAIDSDSKKRIIYHLKG